MGAGQIGGIATLCRFMMFREYKKLNIYIFKYVCN